MWMKELVKKMFYGKKYCSETYIEHLRSKGMKIGDDVIIYVPSKTLIDEQYPWMVTIGNHVRITEGVKILTHDFSWSVLKRVKETSGRILGASGRVIIGNNVFVGMNAIICRNVTIGDDVIIGAGSVVVKDCVERGVYVGNPAHKIMDIGEFYEKRLNMQIKEAKELAVAYYERYGRKPERYVFDEYFMLFETVDTYQEVPGFVEKVSLCGNGAETIDFMNKQVPAFKDFEEFMRFCFDEE